MRWGVLLAICFITGCGPSAAPELGIQHGEFVRCPDSPNCVSSQSADRRHQIEPLAYTGPATTAWDCLIQAVTASPRARVVSQHYPYLRAEFTTRLWRFVDDVEFYLDETARVIHARSASRVGYFDLGTNRRRVERIRREFAGCAAQSVD